MIILIQNTWGAIRRSSYHVPWDALKDCFYLIFTRLTYIEIKLYDLRLSSSLPFLTSFFFLIAGTVVTLQVSGVAADFNQRLHVWWLLNLSVFSTCRALDRYQLVLVSCCLPVCSSLFSCTFHLKSLFKAYLHYLKLLILDWWTNTFVVTWDYSNNSLSLFTFLLSFSLWSSWAWG